MTEIDNQYLGGSREKQEQFGTELRQLINSLSLENDSNTPDIVLTCYLMGCLKAFNASVNSRGNLCEPKDVATVEVEREKNKCEWVLSENYVPVWITSCKIQMPYWNSATNGQFEFKYCPFCGGERVEVEK